MFLTCLSEANECCAGAGKPAIEVPLDGTVYDLQNGQVCILKWAMSADVLMLHQPCIHMQFSKLLPSMVSDMPICFAQSAVGAGMVSKDQSHTLDAWILEGAKMQIARMLNCAYC